MKRSLNLILALSSFVIASAQSSNLLMDSANTLEQKNNFGGAINIYSSILSREPANCKVYECRGLAFEAIHDYTSALQDYQRSVKVNLRYWQGYMRLADLFNKAENYDQALSNYDNAIQFADTTYAFEALYTNRGMVKKRLNDLSGAVGDFHTALQYNPSSLATLSNLGMTLASSGRTEEGIVYLQKAIDIDSTFDGGYGNLSFVYSQTGEYRKALTLSDKLIAMHPDNPIALNNRGFIKYKMNDLPGALEDINNSIHLYAENSYAFKNRGLVYTAMNRKTDACTDFLRAIHLGFTESYGSEVEDLLKKHCVSPQTDKRL